MDDAFPRIVLALKTVTASFSIRSPGLHNDGVTEEVPNIGTKFQERLVGRILGSLDVLQALGSFAS